MNAEEIAVNLIKLSRGKSVDQTRLQKEAYILDQCGAEFGLPFTYHYYGPYSFELAYGWEDALAEGRIEIEEKLGRYGVPYSIFKLKEPCSDPDNLGNLPAADARARLEKMAGVSEIVLELAATIIYLKEEGYGEPPIKELKTRKPLKATDKLIKKATDLLSDLQLSVASD